MHIPFVKPSTIAYWKEARKQGLSVFDRLHGYVYGRWCYHYIGMVHGKYKWLAALISPLIVFINRHSPFIPTGDSQPGDPGQKRPSWADTYHGKAMPLEEATKLVQLNRSVNVQLPEQVVPFTRAREIVLRNPERIVVLDCPCRMGKENPCLPLDVCLIIGDPIASFILEHHPNHSRQITAEEAVDILKAENARGHVSHAFFKDAMLDRFYAICNCCSCCCGAMVAHRMGNPMLFSSGYLAEVDEDKCVACGECARKCQFKAIGFRNGSAFIREDRCMGCGVCVNTCNKDALSLRLAPEKGTPLLVDKL